MVVFYEARTRCERVKEERWPMEPVRERDTPVAIEIIQGKGGAEFAPTTLTIAVGTIVMWTNRTAAVQVFQLGRRVITLAPTGQNGAVGLTKFGAAGTTSHVLQSSPMTEVMISVQASN